VNILRTAPFKAVNFYAFDFYRKAFLARKEERELTNWERIAAGAAAGATATVVCFPMDTVSIFTCACQKLHVWDTKLCVLFSRLKRSSLIDTGGAERCLEFREAKLRGLRP
jgi:hypothetical protein